MPSDRFIQNGKLVSQRGLDALARFVVRPELVAEGFHDGVGRDAHMCRSFVEKPKQRAHHTAHRRDVYTAGIEMRGNREIVAK